MWQRALNLLSNSDTSMLKGGVLVAYKTNHVQQVVEKISY